jgi:tetratricopeptide (TPR) repeat protein
MRCYMRAMNITAVLGRRAAVAVCIVLSACAAAPPAPGSHATAAAYGAFLAARFADAQQDPATATTYYQLALRADPRNRNLIDEGFIAAILAGSPRATALAGKTTNGPLSAMLLGNQAALRGDFSGAQAKFNSLPANDLTGLVKPLLVAWAQLGAGNDQAALAGLTPYFSDPNFGPVFVLNAALIADLGNDKQDAAQFYNAVESSQPNLRLVQVVASWQARQGDIAAARGELAQLVQTHPDLAIALPALQATAGNRVVASATDGMAEAYLTLAGALNQPAQLVLRTTFLRFALMLRPDLTAARLLLADVQSGSFQPAKILPTPGQLNTALQTLAPVRADDPLFGPAALQRAGLLASTGQPAAAVTLLDQLIAANQGDPYLLQVAGDVLRGNSQYQQAVGYYSRAIAASGQPAPASAWSLYFDRAICEDQLGNWRAAEPDLQTAVSLSPNQPYVLNYLGYTWALHGEKLPQAAAMLQKATGLDPNDGAVIDSLGYVKLRQGQTAAAVGLLTQAVELVPTDAEVNAHLGDAFLQAGMGLQANYQYQRALSLQPDEKLKLEILGKLKLTAEQAPPHAG